jgi:hypothetical protein
LLRTKAGFTRPGNSSRFYRVESVVPDHPYFKIQYSLSMRDRLPTIEAKERWKGFGELLTTADGDFLFETDLIMNKIPEPKRN